MKIDFNKWVYGAYCGVMIQLIVEGNYTSALIPLGFIFMFIGFELIRDAKLGADE